MTLQISSKTVSHLLSKSFGVPINVLSTLVTVKPFDINCAKFHYDCGEAKECKKKTKKEKEPEPSLWKNIFGKKKKKKKPPMESCRFLAQCKRDFEEIPKFVEEMRQKFPHCDVCKSSGSAYVFKCPNMHEPHPPTKEEILIQKIERDKTAAFKEDMCNPMPRYTTVGQRLIDLHERKLHPLYKKYEVPPRMLPSRKFPTSCDVLTQYSCCKKPIKKKGKRRTKKKDQEDKVHTHPEPNSEDIMASKQCYLDYKMAELPQYLILRMKQQLMLNKIAQLDTLKIKKKECDKTEIPCGKNLTKCKPETDCPPKKQVQNIKK